MVQLTAYHDVGFNAQRFADVSARPCSLCEVFMRQAALHKTRPAVITPDRILRYGELARDARSLAAHLQRLGVGPDMPVAVLLAPGIEQITAQAAIILAGGSVLPLDITLGDEQLADIVRRYRVQITLTSGRLRQRSVATRFVSLEDIPVADGNDRDFAPLFDARRQRTHVLATPGLCLEVDAQQFSGQIIRRPDMHLHYDDRVGCIAATTDYAYQLEVWSALLNGAAAVVLPKATIFDPRVFATALSQYAVSVLFSSNALFNHVARRRPDAFRSLQYLLVEGSNLDKAMVSRVMRHGAPRHILSGGPASALNACPS